MRALLLVIFFSAFQIQYVNAATDTCRKVPGLFVTDVHSNSATLRWESVQGARGYQYVVSKSYTPPDKYGLYTKDHEQTVESLGANSTYYAHVRSSCGIKTSDWVSVQFNTPPPVERNSLVALPFAVQVYPLEADRSITVNGRLKEVGTASVEIYDVLGNLWKSYTQVGDQLHIEISALPAGIYLVKYHDDSGHWQMMRFTRSYTPTHT